MPLEGTRILITGGGSGIGRSLALEAARRGGRVLVAGRSAASLIETAELAPRGMIETQVADVTVPVERRALIGRLRASGGLSILVNNAGTQNVGPLADLGDNELTDMIATNLVAPAALIRDSLVLLRSAEQPRIANIGSMFGLIGFPLFAAYSASKAGLRGLSDALRRELAPQGIAVTYVAPRATRTAVTTRAAHLIEPFAMRVDEPDDVALRAWDGIERGQAIVYPGFGEQMAALLQQLTAIPVDRTLTRQFRRVAGGDRCEDATQFQRPRQQRDGSSVL